MGAIAAYSLYSSIFLLAGYLLYKLAMAGDRQTSLNRATLLGIYAFSLIAMPLNELGLANAADFNAAIFPELINRGVEAGTHTPTSMIPFMIIAIYMAGVIVTTINSIATAIRLTILVRSGHHEVHGNYTLVILPLGKAAPFSWGKYIVMGEDEYAVAGDMITAHELAHIQSHHSIDLVIAQLVCIFQWYNPAAWLMREEIKTVHEYQADEIVIASGIEPRKYQMLLIKKAVGTRFQSLANSLNHSNLKKRITMMYKEKNSGLRRLRGLALVMAPVAAMAVVNLPAVAGAISTLDNASLNTEAVPQSTQTPETAPQEDKGTKKISDEVAKLAEYPGGMNEMMVFLMKNTIYPEGAYKAKHQGKVKVRFVVEKDGTLSNFLVENPVHPELDAEAIRVVKSMPQWIPARDKNDKPIATEYELPINFSLE